MSTRAPWWSDDATGGHNILWSTRGQICSILQERQHLARSSVSIAAGDNGTRCSRPAFMRSAGMRHSAACRSISLHVAARASPDRTAVRMMNRRQLFSTSLAVHAAMASNAAPTSAQGSAAWCFPLASCGQRRAEAVDRWRNTGCSRDSGSNCYTGSGRHCQRATSAPASALQYPCFIKCMGPAAPGASLLCSLREIVAGRRRPCLTHGYSRLTTNRCPKAA